MIYEGTSLFQKKRNDRRFFLEQMFPSVLTAFMQAKRTLSTSILFLLTAVLMLFGLSAATVKATPPPTLWTGSSIDFTQSDSVTADVLIPGAVSLTRNFRQWLYNANVDPGPIVGSPSDTEWAFGDLADYASLTYKTFDQYRNGDLSGVLVTDPPSPMVVHLINENIYLQLTFTAWPPGGGFFSYTRSTPAAVTAPPPSVTITNPAGGAVFAAPANVLIAADATVSSGTVTNVQFFTNSSPAGSSQSAPFKITAGNLSPGSYALTAVATASGVSSTSAPVNISVVTPVATSLSAAGAANNQFTFSYSATPGLSYVVEGSSNLFTWTPIVTNVAQGNPAFFTNDISGDGTFFRVGRLPNP